jgi:hypothetical protein
MTELRPPHEKLQGMMEKDSVLAWHSHAPRCRAAPGGRASTHVGRQGRTLTWRRRQGIISERIVVRKLLPAQSHPPLANKNKRSRRPARGQRKRQTRGTTGDRARSPVPWPAGQRSPAIASCGQRLLSLLAFVYFEKTRVPWPDVVRRVHTLQGSAGGVVWRERGRGAKIVVRAAADGGIWPRRGGQLGLVEGRAPVEVHLSIGPQKPLHARDAICLVTGAGRAVCPRGFATGT